MSEARGGQLLLMMESQKPVEGESLTVASSTVCDLSLSVYFPLLAMYSLVLTIQKFG